MGTLSFGLARSEGRYVDCSLSSPAPVYLCRRSLTADLDDAFRPDQDANRYFFRYKYPGGQCDLELDRIAGRPDRATASLQ